MAYQSQSQCLLSLDVTTTIVHLPAQTDLSCLRPEIKASGLSQAAGVLGGIIFYIIPPLDIILSNTVLHIFI